MRMIVLVVAICTATAVWSQEVQGSKATVSDLLAKLHSKDWTERSDAVDEIRSDPHALHSRKIQAALIDLLDWENRKADNAFREAGKQSHHDADTKSGDGGGEGYGEYCAWLSQTVESFANWDDPREACILVNAAQVTYPSTPVEAAARAKAAMPCLLERAKSDLTINKEIVVPMLAEAIEKAHGTLDATTALTAKEIILGDLHDPHCGN
jgi:hypothetical protein